MSRRWFKMNRPKEGRWPQAKSKKRGSVGDGRRGHHWVVRTRSLGKKHGCKAMEEELHIVGLCQHLQFFLKHQ